MTFTTLLQATGGERFATVSIEGVATVSFTGRVDGTAVVVAVDVGTGTGYPRGPADRKSRDLVARIGKDTSRPRPFVSQKGEVQKPVDVTQPELPIEAPQDPAPPEPLTAKQIERLKQAVLFDTNVELAVHLMAEMDAQASQDMVDDLVSALGQITERMSALDELEDA